MNAPERIWARPDYNECWPKRLEEEDVEYIRADLAHVQPAQGDYFEGLEEGIKIGRGEPQPDPRDEVIKGLVEALKMMRSTYPYNPPCYGWQEQVEAHKAAKAALAAAIGYTK